MSAREIRLFDLEDFAENVRLSPITLEHMQSTGNDFDIYLKTIRKTLGNNDYDIMYDWLDNAFGELISSNDIEKKKLLFTYKELLSGELFFDNTHVTEKRIKDIHSFIADHSDGEISLVGEYRKDPVWLGYYNENHEKVIRAYAANPEDINSFMKMLIKVINKHGLSMTYSNPFIKAALIHLMFIKIHPFVDGNGRTGRILQNIVFADVVNDIYDTNLKLAPMSISRNIQLSKSDYVNRINNVEFDIDVDNYEALNRWFDYILNMYDEQIFFQNNRMDRLKEMSFIQSRLNLDKEEVTSSDSFKRVLGKSKLGRMGR